MTCVGVVLGGRLVRFGVGRRHTAIIRPAVLSLALVCGASLYGSEADEIVRQSVPVTTGTHLHLDADFGNINVKPADGRTVGVEVHFRGDPPSRRELDKMLHDFSLKVVQQGTEINVSGRFTHGWEPVLSYLLDGGFFSHRSFCHDWHCLTYSWLDEIEFRVNVPRQFAANLTTSGGSVFVSQLKGDVSAHSSGGWLSFDRVEGPISAYTSGGGIVLVGVTGRSNVHTSGGGIRISDTSGDVEAYTSGGGISIDTVSGRVKVRTSGGWIDARGISGPIDAFTSGGGITAVLVSQPHDECRFDTSGGGVMVTLPADAHVNLDASTSGGGVTTEFPVPYTNDHDHNAVRAPLNGGGPLVYLHTSGGSIVVKRAGAI